MSAKGGESVSTSSDLTPCRIHEEARTRTWSVSKSDRPFHPPNKYSLRKEQTNETIVYGRETAKRGGHLFLDERVTACDHRGAGASPEAKGLYHTSVSAHTCTLVSPVPSGTK